METRTAPLIGGRYRIDGLLGEGGMARVFGAFDERLERPAAVKVLRAETRALPGMRQRFQQEALIAARLVHPRIVAVLDFGEDQESSYLVMERLPGSTLRDEIISRGPLPAGRVLLVMAETLDALASAHARGILHRDIKPSNILLEQDGHTKISDFGIAKSFDLRADPAPQRDDLTVTGVVLGTPGYLAPERRIGHPATVQSDLYAVGAVMVEALTGQRLGPEPVPTEKIPPPLRDVARRAMAFDPGGRFASANDMLRSLHRAADPTAPATRPADAPRTAPTTVATAVVPRPAAPGTAVLTSPRPPRAPRTARRGRRLALALFAAVALAGGLFFVLGNAAQQTAPAESASSHHGQTQALTRKDAKATDSEAAALTSVATALAHGGLPGDGALASALQETAAQAPGAARQSAAQQALSLAGVLLGGDGITSGQYQDVANVLQAAGATVPTTTTTTTMVTAPTQPTKAPFFPGHGHGHDRGFGGGDLG